MVKKQEEQILRFTIQSYELPEGFEKKTKEIFTLPIVHYKLSSEQPPTQIIACDVLNDKVFLHTLKFTNYKESKVIDHSFMVIKTNEHVAIEDQAHGFQFRFSFVFKNELYYLVERVPMAPISKLIKPSNALPFRHKEGHS